MSSIKKRAQFTTRIGAIATTVGSAVGLGNIWRFPYEAGNYGGAFMLCYICFIFLIGIPVIVAEFILGRSGRSNAPATYRHHEPKGSWWHLNGWMGVLGSLMILSFYSVVAGWTLEYTVQSAVGALDCVDRAAYHERFDTFSTGTWRPALWTLLFLGVNYIVVAKGVTKGIERMSNIMMPLLFVLLVMFCISSLSMDGAMQGLSFLFRPDFSQFDSSMLLGAMGQAFFSLSLGLGCMLTYASYFAPGTRLVRTAITTASLDTLVAILSGIIIFPAVFTFGMSPEAGPALVFEVLPAIFHQLPGGVVWSTLFFLLLLLASLSSTISMSEISITCLTDGGKMGRRTATLVNTLIAAVFGTLCALSFGPLADCRIFGMTIFNLFDYIASNVLLPLGGMICSIFVGWKLDRAVLARELAVGRTRPFTSRILVFALRYLCPAGIALVFLDSIGVI